MLGFLKIQPLNLNDKEHYRVVDLIHSVIDYLKGITVFDSILPKDPELPQSKDATLRATKKSDLFPSGIQYDDTILQNTSAIPCSTLQQPLVKMESNYDGTFTWNFDNGSMAVTPNAKHLDIVDLKYNDDIPDLPNPEFFDVELNKKNLLKESSLSVSPGDSDMSQMESSSPHNSQLSDNGKDKKSIYPCEYCGAEFKIKGYLTRHIKKHALNKAYECPFFEEHSDSKCHPNGGFSRRDTYKTHLKARHFKYPKGTKSGKRSSTPGHCAACFKTYANNEEWVEKHIEGGECTGLPKGYQIRVKNTRVKHYDFPRSNTNGINSPVSLTSNSPDQQHQSSSSIHTTSPSQQDHQKQQNPHQFSIPSQAQQQQQQQTQSYTAISVNQSPLSIISSNVMTNEKLSFESLDFENYDENDEFSLDVEQCLSYRPVSR